MKYKNILFLVVTLILSLVVGLGSNSALAWTKPTLPAPDNNVPGPLNVGSSFQEKTGGIILGSLRSRGPALLNDLVVVGIDPNTTTGGSSASLNVIPNKKIASKDGNFFSKMSNFFSLTNLFKTEEAVATNGPTCNPACTGYFECTEINGTPTCWDPLLSMTLGVVPQNVSAGGAVDVTWGAPDENYTCTASSTPTISPWNGVVSWSGTKHITSINQTTTFNLYCYQDVYPSHSKTMTSVVTVNGTPPHGGTTTGQTGGISSPYTGYNLVVFGNSYFNDDVKIKDKKVCLEDGTNCGGQFGGTFTELNDLNNHTCENKNPLTGACTCPSGFTKYKMATYGAITGAPFNMYGCYR